MQTSDHFGSVSCRMEMQFSSETMERALQVLLSDVGRTEALSGCMSCSVSRDAVELDRVIYRLEWESEASLKKHLRSEAFRRVLVAVDMCMEEPRVEIGSMSGRRGLAYLREMWGEA